MGLYPFLPIASLFVVERDFFLRVGFPPCLFAFACTADIGVLVFAYQEP